MAITQETVRHVAKLARLELGENELVRMREDLGRILEYMEKLGELDTASVSETVHGAVEVAPLRPDRVAPGVPTETALSQAPRSSGQSFAVPAFVDE